MASRARGPLVFFKKVRLAAAKPKPFLKPGGAVGRRVMVAELKRGISTMSGKKSLSSANVEGVASKAVRVGAFAAQQAAQRKAPVRKGRLRASINARQRTKFLWTVGTNVVYGRWVEEGRRGGTVIRPKRAKALRFHWANAPADVRRRFSRRGRGRGSRR